MSTTQSPLCKISDELAEFFNIKSKSYYIMKREEICRKFSDYVKTHNLKDPVNGGVIIIDDKISKLFKIKKNADLNSVNLYRHLASHYIEIDEKCPDPINLKMEENLFSNDLNKIY